MSGNDLRVTIKPEWEEVERVRIDASAFLTDRNVPQIVDAITMVACELTENALKYGYFDTGGTVTVSIETRADSITVKVTNPIGDPANDDLARLAESIRWIHSHADPLEAFLQRLREVAEQTLESDESGLGLVRIAYEGRAKLDYRVDGNMVAVSAVVPLPGVS